jgi:hypothetical protein
MTDYEQPRSQTRCEITVVNELATALVEQLSKHAEYMTDYSSAGGGGIHRKYCTLRSDLRRKLLRCQLGLNLSDKVKEDEMGRARSTH